MTMKYTDADISALDYSNELILMKTGAKSAPVSTVKGSNKSVDRLRVQLGEYDNEFMRAPFGLSEPHASNKDSTRRAFDLSIDSDKMLVFLTSLDEKNKQAARDNSFAWFKKQLTDAEIDAFYTPIVKPSSKPEYRPTVRTKVVVEGTTTQVFVVTKETPSTADSPGTIDEVVEGSIEDLSKGCRCIPIVECPSVWFAQKSFGMSLTASHILVWPMRHKRGLEAFSFANGPPKIAAQNISNSAKQPTFFDPMDLGADEM